MWGVDMGKLKIENLKFKMLESLKTIDPTFYALDGEVLTLSQKGKHYADRIAAELFIED